ncbi:MAG: GTP 3',8-cyclase MoaA [Desulfobacterales bacterium]|nr:GTP 3',8-cyclase MoaA [Desulfobacterales bacterium]
MHDETNIDPFDRRITYLRVSVTDRCNLRCCYCVSADGLNPLPHSEILRYEEIIEIVRAATDLGIRKLRITGGEPLIRRDILPFIRLLAATPGIEEIGVTTNGILLKDMAGPLSDAGIKRINISLDTLNPLKFRKITRRDSFYKVMDGIAAATEAFSLVKLNMVVIRGLNDNEIPQFVELAMHHPYVVRFIECMPIGKTGFWDIRKVLTFDEIKSRIELLGSLHQVPSMADDGPAKRYRLKHAKGEIGIISPLSHNFCADCNRIRLTANGKLRPCLFSDHEIDIKGPVRSGCTHKGLTDLIQKAIAQKPRRHYAGLDRESHLCSMSMIGG